MLSTARPTRQATSVSPIGVRARTVVSEEEKRSRGFGSGAPSTSTVTAGAPRAPALRVAAPGEPRTPPFNPPGGAASAGPPAPKARPPRPRRAPEPRGPPADRECHVRATALLRGDAAGHGGLHEISAK